MTAKRFRTEETGFGAPREESFRDHLSYTAGNKGLWADSPQADRALVDRCLAGEASAWDALYHTCHETLLASIRHKLLPQKARDSSLVDEIAARVWYALVRDNGKLLDRFDPTFGVRLPTFLAAIAKDLMCRLFRSEFRRRRREAASLRDRASSTSSSSLPFALDDFVTSLTPAERTFYERILAPGVQDPSSAGYSKTNAWQLTSRIQRKLREALRNDEY